VRIHYKILGRSFQELRKSPDISVAQVNHDSARHVTVVLGVQHDGTGLDIDRVDPTGLRFDYWWSHVGTQGSDA